MVEPILAQNDIWYTQGNSGVKRSTFTEIEIKDLYIPDSSEVVSHSWDGSAALDGSIMCYIIGTKLIISGNGSGRIYANPLSGGHFSEANISDTYSNVTSLSGLSLMDTSKSTNMNYMFAGLKKLKSIDLTGFDTDNVTMMNGMFYQCTSLESLNLSSFNTSQCSRMMLMFYQCKALTSLDISMFDMSKIEKMKDMFGGTTNLHNIVFPKHFVLSDNCGNLFKGKQFMNIDTSEWDVSTCTSMASLFEGCEFLRQIDVSRWDVANVADMSFMFYGCSSLKEIDVSNWDVSKVTNFDHFAAHANLKRKGIENWKTTSATNMNALFHNCAEEELDLSGWDVSKNQFFCQMFENSPNLKRIKGLENWNTSAGLGFDGMFERCYKLEEVDLSAFDTTKAKNNVSASSNGHKTATMNNMFLSCNNLKKVKVGSNFSINGDGTNTTAANKAILPTPSTDYITGADGNWYAFNGEAYTPNAIKDKTAETYFASFDLCADQDVIVKNGSMIDAAKAIREKNGASDHYAPAQFGMAIRALA